MKKLTLYFTLPSYDDYKKYLNLLFEEQPKLKEKNSLYKKLNDHIDSIDNMIYFFKKKNDDIYLRTILPSTAVITTQSLKTLKDLQNFVDKYKIEYTLTDRFDCKYQFSDFINP